jgi:hypothetical protein
MTDPNLDDEALVNRVLREVPARRAPASLQLRVLEELSRRAALPWWSRGFANWPLAARGAFMALCGVIVALTFLGSWAGAGARALQEFQLLAASWTHPAIAAVVSAAGWAELLGHVIPQGWLYGGVAAGTVLYTVLFGLGAAAYHTLYRPQSIAGQQS